jgi:hypothetical protein
MPVPPDYQRLHDGAGVLQVFRHRLELRDAIRFATILPAGAATMRG